MQTAAPVRQNQPGRRTVGPFPAGGVPAPRAPGQPPQAAARQPPPLGLPRDGARACPRRRGARRPAGTHRARCRLGRGEGRAEAGRGQRPAAEGPRRQRAPARPQPPPGHRPLLALPTRRRRRPTSRVADRCQSARPPGPDGRRRRHRGLCSHGARPGRRRKGGLEACLAGWPDCHPGLAVSYPSRPLADHATAITESVSPGQTAAIPRTAACLRPVPARCRRWLGMACGYGHPRVSGQHLCASASLHASSYLHRTCLYGSREGTQLGANT